jgi:hypothetical protein
MHSSIRVWYAAGYCLTWIVASYTLAACTQQVISPPSPVSTTVSIASASDTTATRPAALAAMFSPGEEHYDAHISSSVRLVGDSTSRVESTDVTGRIAVTFAINQVADHITATVQIDSVLVRSHNTITAVSLPNRTSLFNIDRRTGQIKRNATDPQPSCVEGTITAPFEGTEILPTTQSRVTSSSWVDTSYTQICRSALLLTLTRITTYARTPISRDVGHMIRSSRVIVGGSGFQWSQKVDTSGEGEATDTLFFSPSGRLERVSGTSNLRLVFRSPFRTQEFLQTATTNISAIHPAK